VLVRDQPGVRLLANLKIRAQVLEDFGTKNASILVIKAHDYFYLLLLRLILYIHTYSMLSCKRGT
jgi:hypothetical protein